ncbi:hypothetical protein DL546_003169 [Coniochaeta pulveracea]|uniref:Nuclear rim protein 1 n=1 Tax=Coniochaeta pulveracea TaxID=177199 RepID=A0A420YI05_9PEZI|nr:hypothetical protein DL546_003169 [Coniochaeta pulveracea]
MPPVRRVRQQPLIERLKAWLNPLDFLLYISEEIETRDWDSKNVGTQLGLAANFLFLLMRANAGRSSEGDDVFGESRTSYWSTYLVQPAVWILMSASIFCAFHVMTRSRKYRLFETNVEKAGPSTPSAHRVKVDSSPAASSPLRFLADVLASESAESRAHPDKTRDVWEISVWDPLPVSLHFLLFFSPGHLVVYMLFLPLAPLDPRPSVTVFNCVFLQIIMTAQLWLLNSRYTQQIKDTAIIHKEVMHEYDAKFVHPHLHPLVREVGTQIDMGEQGANEEEVELGTPAVLLKRGFQTHPNPNYAKYYDPEYSGRPNTKNTTSPGVFTPSQKPRYSDSFTSIQRPSTVRKSLPPNTVHSYTSSSASPLASAASANASNNYSGHLGVYSHANSPLKKAISLGDLKGSESPRNGRELAALEQRQLAERIMRQHSPVKEQRRATMGYGQPDAPTQSTNPFARQGERFPKRAYNGQ